MLVFLKENGFPISIWIESADYQDPEDDQPGYTSIVTDKDDNVIAKFEHRNLEGRKNWALGFMAGLKYKNENKNKN
jgi:hypothetical protein